MAEGKGFGGGSPFVCQMGALDKEQRERWQQLVSALHPRAGSAGSDTVEELPDGYAFRYPADAKVIQMLAEWVTLERLCCPFFSFEIAVEGGGAFAWLRLRGEEGIKPFILSEFGLT